nr:integrase, catalytic region, zinc finger, CCHC-type, peptidase aspartic, catalytic [Tanacetum cinerariifolium]
MTGQCDKLINFVSQFIDTIRFNNDNFAAIIGYEDLQIRNILILRFYYIEGLGHNLFSVKKFCDLDLEVAFIKHTCFIRSLEGVDLLSGSRGSNLYTISMEEMMKSSPNSCQMGKSKKEYHKPKPEPSTNHKLQMLHIDLCGPMQVESISGKKYILVIVDDNSRFTWVKFLRIKDETPEVIIKILKQAQKLLPPLAILKIDPLFIPDITRLHMNCSKTANHISSSFTFLVYYVIQQTTVRILAKHAEKQLDAVKWVFRYLKGTINMCLWYLKDTRFDLTAFAYVDHEGYQDSRKSTLGNA